MAADRTALPPPQAQNYASIINAQANLSKQQEEDKVAQAAEEDDANEFEFEINDYPQQVHKRPQPKHTPRARSAEREACEQRGHAIG